MKGVVSIVEKQKKSKHGGIYIRAIIKDITQGVKGMNYTFDCYLQNTKSARFLPYLKPQAIFDNLDIINWKGRNVVSGNSQFIYLGQRHN